MADLLACPVCNARVAPGAARCVVCRSSLTGLARPATVAMTPPVYAQPAASSDDDDELATADDTTHQRERFEPGLKIRNRYLLRRAMGDGVLGTAWEARDQHHGAEVVLKVVADMLVTNERERIDLVGKLEMFAGRSLPGVVMPREVFAVPGAVVVVYPRVEAASLRAVIDARRTRGERFTPEECLRVVQSLVTAIQAMHSASPHGALWPQNVLLTARGALLVDGFLAVSVAPERLAARIGHHPRSSPFAAPELLAARRPTASADLYALGAIVADLAGGAPPGEGPDLASISRELHRAAASLLDREPGRRPAGVRALLDALTVAAGLAQRPADPLPPSPDDVLAHGALPSPVDDRPPLDPPTLPAPESPRAMARPAPVMPVAPPSPAAPSRLPVTDRPPAGPMQRVAPPVSSPPAPAMARPAPSSRPPAPMVTQCPAPPPADPLDAPPGRLRGPTATIPANAPRASNGVTSGPPPSMAVKSGPPPAQRPPAPIAPTPAPPPAASVAPVSASPASAPPDARVVPKTLPSINDAMLAAHPQRAPVSPSRLPMPPRPSPASPPVPPRPSVSARPPPAPPVPSRPSPPIATARPPMPPSPSRLPLPSSPARPPVPSAPSRPPSPMVSSPPPRRAPAPVERSMSDDDGIDPKLLRAAQLLDDERRRDR